MIKCNFIFTVLYKTYSIYKIMVPSYLTRCIYSVNQFKHKVWKLVYLSLLHFVLVFV